jgi:hypothetical protein
MEFHYTSHMLSPSVMTSSMKILPTTTYNDVPRRALDILIIGSPMPLHRPVAADIHERSVDGDEKDSGDLYGCDGACFERRGVVNGKKAPANRAFCGGGGDVSGCGVAVPEMGC